MLLLNLRNTQRGRIEKIQELREKKQKIEEELKGMLSDGLVSLLFLGSNQVILPIAKEKYEPAIHYDFTAFVRCDSETNKSDILERIKSYLKKKNGDSHGLIKGYKEDFTLKMPILKVVKYKLLEIGEDSRVKYKFLKEKGNEDKQGYENRYLVNPELLNGDKNIKANWKGHFPYSLEHLVTRAIEKTTGLSISRIYYSNNKCILRLEIRNAATATEAKNKTVTVQGTLYHT